jgi:hypothetical protein
MSYRHSTSYRQGGAGVLVSGAIGALAGIALVGGMIMLLALPSSAQSPRVQNRGAQTVGAETTGVDVAGETKLQPAANASQQAQTHDAASHPDVETRTMIGVDAATLASLSAQGIGYTRLSGHGFDAPLSN